jgi:hypothetical protein
MAGFVVGGEVLAGAAAGVQATARPAHIPEQRQSNMSFGGLTHEPVNARSMQNRRRRHIHIGGSGLRTVILPSTVAASVTQFGGWSDPRMRAYSRREAANAAGKGKDGLPCSVKASQDMAAMRAIRLVESRARRASRGRPFQFVRWLAALGTVLVDWVQSGPPQSAVAYLPVLTVVALLLLPDAESIEVASLRFERLKTEVGLQKRAVDRLCDEVSSISNSLIAGSQVNITLGGSTIDAAAASPDTGSPRERGNLIAPHLTAEGVRPEHELPRSNRGAIGSRLAWQTSAVMRAARRPPSIAAGQEPVLMGHKQAGRISTDLVSRLCKPQALWPRGY